MYRPVDAALQLERQQIDAHGALSSLASEQQALFAERARLRAEADNAPKVAFPQSADAVGIAAQSVQQALFDSRRVALNARMQTFDESKRLYSAEISTLQDKLRVLSSQSDLYKADLDNVFSLMKKGLTTEPRRIAMEQNLSQVESTKLEVELSIIRAQEGAAAAERDKDDALNTRKSEALKDLAAIDAKIAQNDSARATAMRLADEAGARLKREDERVMSEQTTPVYAVRRKGLDQQILMTETDVLRPGDVLKVGDGGSASASN